MRDRRMTVHRQRPGKVLWQHVDAEIRTFEQFGDQNYLGTVGRGKAYKPLSCGNIFVDPP